MNALVILAFFVPGLVVGTALRLRGWALVGGAPALTAGVIALGTVVLGPLHIYWNLLSVSLWTLVLAAFLGLITWLVRRRNNAGDPILEPKRSLGEHLMIAAGVVVGAGFGVFTYLRGLGYHLDTVNQDWDAPHHGNAVRWIAEHGTPLPSALAPLANLPEGASYFYPNTYHALLAPLLDTVVPMPQLLNLGAMAIIVAWVAGVAALAATWRMPAVAAAAAAVTATWFTAFPYDSLWRGPLWPYVAGVAMIPGALAIARKILTVKGLTGPLGLGLSFAGLTGLHTSLAFVAATYGIVLLAAFVFKLEPIDWKNSRKRLIATAAWALACLIPIMLPALSQSAGVTGAQWDEFASPAEGIGQVLLFSPTSAFPQWFLGLAAIVGIWLMIRHRRLVWVVGAWVVFGALYAACASLNNAVINILSGPFYNDAWRFAALLPLAGALAVGELTWTVSAKVTEKFGSRVSTPRAAFVVPVVVALAFGAVLGVLSKGGYIGRNSHAISITNRSGDTVSPGEREAYQWLSQHSKGHPVMNDRQDGSVWLYALAGVQPMEWSYYGAKEETDQGILTRHLQDIDKDPKIRQIIDEHGIKYVLFGVGYVRPYTIPAPGLQTLDKLPEMKKVYENPQARVYEILPAGSNGRS
ncbi:DUF6541 family protein [Lentzea sp. NPDC006480]|uniref:DUF6541 family protein n=1 Tax=Lentzea sp. NPDC006480 TaxID=3157176 RepID=UPI0033A4DB1B